MAHPFANRAVLLVTGCSRYWVTMRQENVWRRTVRLSVISFDRGEGLWGWRVDLLNQYSLCGRLALIKTVSPQSSQTASSLNDLMTYTPNKVHRSVILTINVYNAYFLQYLQLWKKVSEAYFYSWLKKKKKTDWRPFCSQIIDAEFVLWTHAALCKSMFLSDWWNILYRNVRVWL